MNKEKIINEKGERGKERKKGRKEKRKLKHVVIAIRMRNWKWTSSTLNLVKSLKFYGFFTGTLTKEKGSAS